VTSVIVIGGGIGGLTTALSLHAAGIDDVRVLERVRTIEPLGVGINLLPHAVRELSELGLADELAAIGVATAELAYYDRYGSRIWVEPRGRAAGYHWPQYSVHRGLLQLMLLAQVKRRLGPDAVEVASPVSGAFTHDGHGLVRVGPAQEGREIAADVVVAADGIHSTVRAQWHPDEGPPEWNGAVLWRGTTWATPFLTGASMIMAGHRAQKFVAYPISGTVDGRQRLNWIAERVVDVAQFRREDWNRQVSTDVFSAHFADWRFDWLDIPALIDEAEAVYEYPMVDRLPLESWVDERVVLLGDAAHPTFPIGSNGSSQAILDARVLAHCLATQPTDRALRRYQELRLPPTRALQQANRRMGPEIVMQTAYERAPDGFVAIEDVFAPGELERVAAEYKSVAGFSPNELNERASWSVT
jgi:2-polyprenyl-6-methoxyphenol hydroxylase-like FAD-dependent oxidoreductase